MLPALRRCFIGTLACVSLSFALIPVFAEGSSRRNAVSTAPDRRPSSATVSQTTSSKGTLTVGATVIQLRHARVFAQSPDKATYRLLLTDRPLSGAAAKLALTAGANDDDRLQLAAEMAGDNVRGIETVVGHDGTLIRINIYSAETAMGMMLLERGTLDVTLTNDTMAGTLSTDRPLHDARVGKAVAYAVSFSAAIEH